MSTHTTRTIANLEESLHIYHGLRLMWSNGAANHALVPTAGGIEVAVSLDWLVAEQRKAIWTMAHFACELALEIQPTGSPHREFVPRSQMQDPCRRFLYHQMSTLSEECWRSGWNHGIEYELWRLVQVGAASELGMGSVSEDELRDLDLLADIAGGWWSYIDLKPTFLDMPRWTVRYQAWLSDASAP